MKIRLTAALGLSAALLLSACAANEPNTSAPAPADTNTTAAGENTTAPEVNEQTEEAPAPSSLSGTLAGSGASAQEVAQQTWIAGFQTANTGVTINYISEGSGTGREKMIAGSVDYAGSDRAFKIDELADNSFGKCVDKVIDIPVYISPIAVVFNLDGVDSLNLDAATVAGIFRGDITKWNDEKIAALNDGVELPDTAITAVRRADKSGTTGNFTGYLAATAPDVWTDKGDDEWPATLTSGEAANQTQGVVQAVSGGTGTIGYLDASQAGDMSIAKIGKAGAFFEPSAEAAAQIVENSPVEEGRTENDMAIALDRQAEGYPIVLVSYLLVCQEYRDSAIGELVKAYATYIVSAEGQQASAERAHSAPLSPALAEKALAAINSIK